MELPGNSDVRTPWMLQLKKDDYTSLVMCNAWKSPKERKD